MGWLVLETLGETHHIAIHGQLPYALYGEGTIGTERVLLAKPQTFMNASGEAVASLCTHFAIAPHDVIVIHDDLDLVLGRVQLKTKGGDAGHYGVRSIIECLGMGDFSRIRVGIGRPATKEEVVDFVLSPFTPDELPLVGDAIHKAMALVEDLLG
jgi:PTH1 family peptidyl-tRNA hydrolase